MRKNSNIEKTRRNKLIVSYGGTEKYYRELDGEIAVQKTKNADNMRMQMSAFILHHQLGNRSVPGNPETRSGSS